MKTVHWRRFFPLLRFSSAFVPCSCFLRRIFSAKSCFVILIFFRYRRIPLLPVSLMFLSLCLTLPSNCSLLCYYVASVTNFVLTFRGKLRVLLRMGPMGCP